MRWKILSEIEDCCFARGKFCNMWGLKVEVTALGRGGSAVDHVCRVTSAPKKPWLRENVLSRIII